VTQTGRFDLNQNLTRARTLKVHFHDFQWLTGCNGNRGFRAHICFPNY
jgi:hypothetical protein